MSEKLTLTKNELAIFQSDIPAIYKVENYVVNVAKNQVDFMQWCKFIIQQALDCKGDNKTDKAGEATMTVGFAKAIMLEYSHVSLNLIEQTLIKNRFGEGYTASWGGLIETLQKAGLSNQSIENKKKLAIQTEAEYLKALDDKRIKDFELNGGKRIKQRCLDRYEDWKKRGEFVDLFNETYSRILKHPILKDEHSIELARKIATERSTSQILIKKERERNLLNFDTVKFLNSLLKDRKLLEEQDSYIFFFKHEMVKCYFSYRLKQENENKTK